MKRTSIFMGLLLVTASPGYAEQEFNSDRPGVADGSDTVGGGRVQIETGLQREVRKAGDDPRRETFLPTLLRVGFGEDWEARLESDVYSWMRQSDGARAEAWAPFSLGFKYHFLEAQAARPSLGVIVGISPPSGSNALRTRHTTGDVRLAADWELTSQWSLNPNVGFGVDEDDEGRRFSTRLVATTLAYKPVPTLELSVDIAAQKPEARGAGSTPPRSFLAAGFSKRF